VAQHESDHAEHLAGPVLHLEIRHLRLDYAGIRAADPVFEERLLASIAREGQRIPILVAEAEAHAYQVLDGFRRLRALQQLGQDVVLAIAWPTGAIEGLVEVRRIRTASRAGPLEEGWLIEALVDRHSLSLAQIALRLSRTKSWVHRRLALVRQLPEAVREKVLMGTLSAYVATKFAVPLARANAGLVTPYCDSVIAHGLTTRQAGLVYQSLMRVTDPKIHQEILARPERVLAPAEEAPWGARGSGATPRALDTVGRLEGWCRHTASAYGTVGSALAQGLSEDTLARISLIWRDHRELARSLVRQLDDLAVLGSRPEVLARANAAMSLSATEGNPC
jgi:ParB/RepB/Spo0J family partition protein